MVVSPSSQLFAEFSVVLSSSQLFAKISGAFHRFGFLSQHKEAFDGDHRFREPVLMRVRLSEGCEAIQRARLLRNRHLLRRSSSLCIDCRGMPICRHLPSAQSVNSFPEGLYLGGIPSGMSLMTDPPSSMTRCISSCSGLLINGDTRTPCPRIVSSHARS